MFSNDNLPFTKHSDVLNAPTPDDAAGVQRLVDELKRRGNAAFKQKALDEAEVLYSKAIEVSDTSNENYHVFLSNRSAARCAMSKGEQALEDADQCIEVKPDFAKGYFRRAQALNKLKRHREAVKALEKASEMEPENKSVKTLLQQTQELAVAAPAATPTPTPVPAKKTVTTAKAPAKPKAPEKKEAETEQEEAEVGNYRGYKKLADGRVTTYFNNELTDEAKELIGDIAPKRVEDESHVKIKNVQGGSAWNQGNTFEEKDMSKWAKNKLETCFTGISAPTVSGDGVVTAGSVSDLSGEASIAVVRGAKRYIYGFAFTLDCYLEKDGERVDGKLKFLDLSSDADGDADVEAVVPSRYNSEGGKMLHAALNSSSSPFRKALEKQVEAFVQEYHAF